jgi:hypothetical protein
MLDRGCIVVDLISDLFSDEEKSGVRSGAAFVSLWAKGVGVWKTFLQTAVPEPKAVPAAVVYPPKHLEISRTAFTPTCTPFVSADTPTARKEGGKAAQYQGKHRPHE